MRLRIGHLVLHVFLLLLGFTFTVPLLWVLSTSLKANNQIFTDPIQWIPPTLQWNNYTEIGSLLKFNGVPAVLYFMKNTAVVTTIATLGTTISSFCVGYSLARLRWRGRNVVMLLVLSTMMLPGVVTLVPSFIVFKTLGWLDSFAPLVVPTWFGVAFSIFLIRQFLTSLPLELEEAARIDGAGTYRIIWQLIIPLSKPVIAAVAIFAFLHHYNDFLHPLIYLDSNENYTLALGLNMFRGRYVARWQNIMALTATMVIPIIVLFFFAQKQFIRGIHLSGLTGR